MPQKIDVEEEIKKIEEDGDDSVFRHMCRLLKLLIRVIDQKQS